MVAFTKNIPELVAIKYIDGCYLFVNKYFEDWVGVGRDVVIGKALSVFLSL
jgi:PAS domain-containing protein|tara:strand:+ start:72 stop:224 length:153 start_codon:yes stop_codon:yes gene_type:complete